MHFFHKWKLINTEQIKVERFLVSHKLGEERAIVRKYECIKCPAKKCVVTTESGLVREVDYDLW